MCGGDACELCHWVFRWSFPWGHRACEVCADMGGGDACELRQWDFGWGSRWGHGARDGCAEIGGGPLGLSVELPMGPRNARGVCRNKRRGRMRSAPLGPS
eukprot:7516490-Pyramimonas_sp.AAC.1